MMKKFTILRNCGLRINGEVVSCSPGEDVMFDIEKDVHLINYYTRACFIQESVDTIVDPTILQNTEETKKDHETMKQSEDNLVNSKVGRRKAKE